MSRVRARCRGGVILTVHCWPAPKLFGVDGFVFHRPLTYDVCVKPGLHADGDWIVYTHRKTGFRAGLGATEQSVVADVRAAVRLAGKSSGQSSKRWVLNAIRRIRASIADGSWKK